MQQTQTILNDILTAIIEMHNDSNPVSEFKIATLKRDIGKLATVNEKEHALGILYAIQGDRKAMKSSFEKALSSSMADDADSWNFWVSMKVVGVTDKCLERARELAFAYRSPKLTIDVLAWYVKFLQIKEAHTMIDVLTKYYSDQDGSLEMAKTELEIMESFIKSGKVSEEQLSALGSTVLKLVTDKNLKIAYGVTEHSKERNHISLTYGLNESIYTSDDVSELNFELADRLIDNDLDCIPVVAKFVRLPVEFCKSEVGLV